MIRTNVELEENLVSEALRLTNKRTKKELLNHALKELVSREKRKKILEFEGKVKWRGSLPNMRKSRP